MVVLMSSEVVFLGNCGVTTLGQIKTAEQVEVLLQADPQLHAWLFLALPIPKYHVTCSCL